MTVQTDSITSPGVTNRELRSMWSEWTHIVDDIWRVQKKPPLAYRALSAVVILLLLPTFAGTYAALSLALRETGRYDESRAVLERGDSRGPVRRRRRRRSRSPRSASWRRPSRCSASRRR